MSLKTGESTKVIAGIAPKAQPAGDVNGNVIDRLGFFDAVVHLAVGAATGTPTAQGAALKLQTGDAADGSDMADVDGVPIAALTADNTQSQLNVDLNPLKRYIRAVVTTSFTGGTSPTLPVAVTVALGAPVNVPV